MKKIGYIDPRRIKGLSPGAVTKAADYTITSKDGVTFLVADGSSATVEITLPAALGTGRVILVVAKDVSNAVTVARAGTDVIGADITGYTIIAAWGFVFLADVAAGQWAEILAWQAS